MVTIEFVLSTKELLSGNAAKQISHSHRHQQIESDIFADKEVRYLREATRTILTGLAQSCVATSWLRTTTSSMR